MQPGQLGGVELVDRRHAGVVQHQRSIEITGKEVADEHRGTVVAARRTLALMLFTRKSEMVTPEQALPGRTDQTMPVPPTHAVLGTPLQGPWPDGFETAVFGLGCFWGAEKLFWQTPGVYSTAVGYAGGYTPNPTYEETCSGRTGHTEVVLVVFDPAKVTYEQLLKEFWEDHDPTQGMRQGNDVGTPVPQRAVLRRRRRSARRIERSRAMFQAALNAEGLRRDHAPRSPRSATSTTPSRTTSSTCTRTPAATARCTPPA